MYFSPLSIVLMIYNLIFIIGITWQLFINKKRKAWKECSIMEEGLVLIVLYSISLLFTPFILDNSGAENKGKDLLYLIGIIFFGFELSALGIIVLRNYLICKKDPGEKETRDYETYVHEIQSSSDGIKRDFSRKILHVIVSVSMVVIYIVATSFDAYFKSIGVFQGLGVTLQAGTIGLIICVFWGFSYMFTLQDLFRLNAFHCIPGWGRAWIKTSLRKKECYNFTASSSILLGQVPFLMASPPVFFTISFIATASDAAASTMGMRFGKHKIGINKDKSYEGLLAGMVMTFACGVLVNLFFFPGRIWGVILLSAAISGIFGAFDAIVKRINDNFMNTIVLGSVAWLLYALLLF